MKHVRKWLMTLAMVGTLAATLALTGCGGDDNQDRSPSSAGGTTPTSNPSPAPSSSVTVSIPQNSMNLGAAAYGTNPLVIARGTMVTWTNDDSVNHSATSDTGIWDSGVLTPGQSFSWTFNSAGTFPYYCTVHGKASMSGTIEVQ